MNQKVSALIGLLLLGFATPAAAQENQSYSGRAKDTLQRLLRGRQFKPEHCKEQQICMTLLTRLRAGNFDVLEPDERSPDKPNMPSYRRALKKCPKLDFVETTAHAGSHAMPAVATRNFGIYKLHIAGNATQHEVLVFRAQDYVMGSRNDITKDDKGEPARVFPGQFIAFSYPPCRRLAEATAEDGAWAAYAVDVHDDEWVSELLKIDDSYYVANIVPIIDGNDDPKDRSRWWYRMELWDWGPQADADVKHRRAIYAFVYRAPR